MPWFWEDGKELTRKDMMDLTRRAASESLSRLCLDPRKVLLLPPDITRAHSGAGWITRKLYEFFSPHADVHLIPALGQHVPHTREQNRMMLGPIPEEKIHIHDWRIGCKRIGEIPAPFVKKVTRGRADISIPISINRMVMDEQWDIIIHIGHIVPHEVLGFSSHNKNYFIGLGGKETICASHLIAAYCGIENILGTLVTPLRECFDKAEHDYLGHLPDVYILLVTSHDVNGGLIHTGFYVGSDRETYLLGAKESQKQNIFLVEKPLRKVLTVMQADEFRSTWVANKAVYRTRMAMETAGELLIIAPGLRRFGEQHDVDDLIRKYGYAGRDRILALLETKSDLRDFSHGAAHLINGSSDGRFLIRYAPGYLRREEIESVHYGYMDLAEAMKRYPVDAMKSGMNTMPDGEEVYFIHSPAAGLWSTRERKNERKES
ncbi:MAG: DUF2088 domain-containing protein [Spirochaetales bacterium]|nr:DUF2088 domain-containing protein [Spirochaetales bacterium]